MTEPKSAKVRYRTTNWAACNAALKARGSLTIWLDKDMQWQVRTPEDFLRRRHPVLLEHQVPLFGLALRQSLGLVESMLRMAGLDWRVPDFSTVSRRHEGVPCGDL